MTQNRSAPDTCLVLSLRHLGDAVIVSGFVNSLRAWKPEMQLDILGHPGLETVTRLFCSFHKYIAVEIPVFGHHQRTLASMKDAVQKLRQVRRQKYTYCFNLLGDSRENLIARITAAQTAIAPRWTAGHPFSRHVRTTGAWWLVNRSIEIPATTPSYYASIAYFSEQLGLSPLFWPLPTKSSIPRRDRPLIGLHPGASRLSKQWTCEKWKELFRVLNQKNFQLVLFGSPSEASTLVNEFGREIEENSIEVVASGMDVFLDRMSSVDVLVGMDSFSVHAAHALGLRSIVLYGPFDPVVMTPPGSIALSAGVRCNWFPCYSKNSCRNLNDSFVCIRGIEVADVIRSVEALLGKRFTFA
ncbi:MAG TPA: glycosyltransferase family 9 protein [Terriglobales bacterium]|nr:glycosyltransferase family 9 protein [Acidobacteriaceae bacterium]HKR28992.1 glycosyltransferase family 9 protein [Terriglobales bacterium]